MYLETSDFIQTVYEVRMKIKLKNENDNQYHNSLTTLRRLCFTKVEGGTNMCSTLNIYGADMAISGGTVLTQKNGLQLDHIGIAVNDLEKGVSYIENLTGVKPTIHPPEKGEPWQSGSLMLCEGVMLEILSVNRDYKGIHPLKSILKSFKEPKLFFWYVATDDFDAFEVKVNLINRKIERKVDIKEADSEKHSTYTRGMIGPGFSTVVPNVIQWKHRTKHGRESTACPIKEFKLSSKKAKKINEDFRALGISQVVEQGDDQISLTLETPNGLVTIKNEAIEMPFSKVLLLILRDLLGIL